MKLVATLLLLCAPLCADTDSGIWSDSGIFGPKYSEILTKIQKWQQTYPTISKVVDYGKSVEGKVLRMLVVSKPGKFRSRPTILMTGSTHGNEYLAIEDTLPEELLKQSAPGSDTEVEAFLNRGGTLLFVPILNPDGYDARERENARGVDLNRDWDVKPANFKGFKEVETKLLAAKIKELASRNRAPVQLKLTVDYHCCAGALLYPWSYTTSALPVDALKAHQSIGDLSESLLGAEHGTTGEILGYYPMGTTKDYYYAEYGALAFTFEGRYKEENKLLAKHVKWWTSMLGLLNQSTFFSDLATALPWLYGASSTPS